MGKVDKEMIRIAAEAGAKAAMEKLEKERRRDEEERVDRRLHNTRLLLKNYRLFKKHTDNAVYQVGQLNESIYEILELMERRGPSDFTASIKNSAARTAVLVQHIEVMLGLYKTYCEDSGRQDNLRRWRVVKALYVDDQPVTVQELADREFVAEKTIRRDVDSICEHLAALLFGIDGIKKE
ncbi:MAG: hypothetical protein E7453_06115 [Ruminococcaceae bacterium]|nr:hypothetical protein [Oscillospiraceae bacterium]